MDFKKTKYKIYGISKHNKINKYERKTVLYYRRRLLTKVIPRSRNSKLNIQCIKDLFCYFSNHF